MIRKGMSLDKICELTELPLERIEELADKIKSRDIKFKFDVALRCYCVENRQGNINNF